MSSIITNNTQPKYGPRVQAEYVYKHLYEGVPVETIVDKQFPLTIGRATIYRWPFAIPILPNSFPCATPSSTWGFAAFMAFLPSHFTV